ncbi:hypothetical protein [Legionella moravica]|nr:hypothetical protein [Legionella moravica]
MIGNAIATIIISTWQHSFDYEQAQSLLQKGNESESQTVYLSESSLCMTKKTVMPAQAGNHVSK